MALKRRNTVTALPHGTSEMNDIFLKGRAATLEYVQESLEWSAWWNARRHPPTPGERSAIKKLDIVGAVFPSSMLMLVNGCNTAGLN